MVSPDLFGYFDRCVVLNLRRRTDRLAQFQANVDRIDWAFRPIEVFCAIDAHKVPCPETWQSGGPAYGCMQGHRQILERALMDDLQTILVMEDDAIFLPDFTEQVTKFLTGVPQDWDALWLGGQGNWGPWDKKTGKRRQARKPTETVKPGVKRYYCCERTHCYALRRTMMSDLYRLWVETPVHCDWVLGAVQERYKVYAPDPFLVGQREGFSDIRCRETNAEFWSGSVTVPDDAKVVWLRAPKEVMEELRAHGFHSGNWRDAEGIDRGLSEIFGTDKPDAEKVKGLKGFVGTVQMECAKNRRGGSFSVCTIWHPKAEEAAIREAAGGNLMVIDAASVDDALRDTAELRGG